MPPAAKKEEEQEEAYASDEEDQLDEDEYRDYTLTGALRAARPVSYSIEKIYGMYCVLLDCDLESASWMLTMPPNGSCCLAMMHCGDLDLEPEYQRGWYIHSSSVLLGNDSCTKASFGRKPSKLL